MKYIYLVAYVASIVIANWLLDRFIELPFFGLLSYGTIFFAFVFTLRDHLHRYGLPFVFLAIFSAIMINLICAIYLDIPLRFLLASFLSILLSELADTAVFERLKDRAWHIKVLSSNAFSVPIDSLVFTLIAFLGVFEWSVIVEIIVADIAAKYLLAMLVMSRFILPFRRLKFSV